MLRGLGTLAAALLSINAAHAATNVNVGLQVTISNTLAISVTPSVLGFGSYSLGGAAAVVTQTIGITNLNTSIIADLAISATKFGEVDGEVDFNATIAAPDAANELVLGAIFLSPGHTTSATVSSTVFGDTDGDTAITGTSTEGTGNGSGGCTDNTDRFCTSAGAYPSLTASGVTYYLGDGQNLSIGELVSLVMYFQPPASMTFDATSLTSTLTIVASAGGSEE